MTFTVPPPVPVDPSARARRRRLGLIAAAVIIPIWLGLTGLFIFSNLTQERPYSGDCLASPENHFFGGVEIVDCDGGEARFRVVATSEGPLPCRGREDGVEIVETAKGGRVEWAACVVPM